MVFQCPETGHEISSGIVREDQGLQPPIGKLQVRCLECGRTHVWETAEARFAYTDFDERLPVPARIA